MKHTISVLVENHAGVLSRITGLFSRRGFNIDSLAVGVTEDKTVSRMTIVVEGDAYTVEQLEKQLNKVVDVIKVRTIPQQDLISRELMLIKCTATGRTRSEILDIAKIMNANIVDLTKTTMTLEICDLPDRLDLLEELLKAYNIQEVMRTGTIAAAKRRRDRKRKVMRVKSGKPAAPRRKGQKMKKVLKFLCSRVVIVTLAILVQFCFLLFIVLKLSSYGLYAYVSLQLVSLVVVLWIVTKRDNPSYKIAWIIAILIFPIFGGIFYLVFGNKTMDKKQAQRIRDYAYKQVEESRLAAGCGH